MIGKIQNVTLVPNATKVVLWSYQNLTKCFSTHNRCLLYGTKTNKEVYHYEHFEIQL